MVASGQEQSHNVTVSLLATSKFLNHVFSMDSKICFLKKVVGHKI